ncbi:MAG: hypothetical protein BJBARM4_0070 [Candidatus Parvarchaeum acidiphilum ARMAN-4]|jgi:uncharacterized membrane protein|uniref:Uncharacterized protein n=1 Tax=Candidatus Parvarchaeum acidiphilum ARMAN-4 TaxID=662760 RepID=D2EED3_PARA4|nr:MAG: hypothetical protein BJBARM4_0070 [Candidatus Parvarchaeum acidiphilum ARMAN-4]
MIENSILGIIGIITGVIILISTSGFVYFMLSAYKYGSIKDANKFFGSYMFNNPKRYIFAFLSIVIAAILLATGFIASFIVSFFMNPLSIWEILSSATLIALAAFFIIFTSIDHPKAFLNYIKFLKNKK